MKSNKSGSPCQCEAYKFPHREFSGACEGMRLVEYAADAMNAWDKEELALFNRAEAAAINSENRRG